MVEKILNLEELKLKQLKNINQKNFEKLIEDLRKIKFFEEPPVENPGNHDNKVYTILRLKPNYEDSINGEEYIREDFNLGNKTIYSATYDFSLKICSTCS